MYSAAHPDDSRVDGQMSDVLLLKVGGSRGRTGAAGLMGPVGPVGPVGATGPTGLQGVTGPQGSAGGQGVTGAAGPQGVAGVTGLEGSAGSQGVTGSAGVQGVTGPAGEGGGGGGVCGGAVWLGSLGTDDAGPLNGDISAAYELATGSAPVNGALAAFHNVFEVYPDVAVYWGDQGIWRGLLIGSFFS